MGKVQWKEEVSKRFFFCKKRSKKALICWGLWQQRCHSPQEQKSFGSFFSKKNCFLPSGS
jgi:hypothetical protein